MKMMMSLVLTSISLIVASDDRGINVRVIMPSKEVLEARLTSCNLEHFAKKGSLIKSLSGQTKHVATVALTVECSVRSYEKTVKNLRKEFDRQETKKLLLQALLQDSPGALHELQERGYYEPILKKEAY